MWLADAKLQYELMNDYDSSMRHNSSVKSRRDARERERDDSNSYKVAEIGVEFYSTIASLYCLVFKN